MIQHLSGCLWQSVPAHAVSVVRALTEDDGI